MQCPYCGNDVPFGVSSCPSCGASITDNASPTHVSSSKAQSANAQPFIGQSSPKNQIIYVLLGVFFGCVGVHDFYAGYTGKAIAQLLITVLSCGAACWISWIWAIVEICTVNKDAKGIPFA